VEAIQPVRIVIVDRQGKSREVSYPMFCECLRRAAL
jgi:hypothetical protein